MPSQRGYIPGGWPNHKRHDVAIWRYVQKEQVKLGQRPQHDYRTSSFREGSKGIGFALIKGRNFEFRRRTIRFRMNNDRGVEGKIFRKPCSLSSWLNDTLLGFIKDYGTFSAVILNSFEGKWDSVSDLSCIYENPFETTFLIVMWISSCRQKRFMVVAKAPDTLLWRRITLNSPEEAPHHGVVGFSRYHKRVKIAGWNQVALLWWWILFGSHVTLVSHVPFCNWIEWLLRISSYT